MLKALMLMQTSLRCCLISIKKRKGDCKGKARRTCEGLAQKCSEDRAEERAKVSGVSPLATEPEYVCWSLKEGRIVYEA